MRSDSLGIMLQSAERSDNLQLTFRRDNISRSTYPAATPDVRAVMSGERMLPIVTWVVPASLAPLCLPCAGQQRSREFASAVPVSTP
jgi:hypothetical protein